MHQDIAPRNLLIDPDTQKLLLFDFDRASCGNSWLTDNRDDVSGVIYTLHQLITNDSYFTGIPHWERNMDMVQNLPKWVCNRELDAEVSVFREFLDKWVRKRQSNGIMEQYLKAPNRRTWPEEPPSVSDYDIPWQFGGNNGWKADVENGSTIKTHRNRTWTTLLSMGETTAEQIVKKVWQEECEWN